MYYEYDGYEKSEADIIIEEAQEKLDEIIKKPIRDRLKKLSDWEQKKDKLNKELIDKECKLEREIDKFNKEKELWDANIDKMGLKTINACLNSLMNGVQIGSKVWYIATESERIPCQKCNGLGKLEVKYADGTINEISCGCYEGKETKYKNIIKEDEVESVDVVACFNKDNMVITFKDNYCIEGGRGKIYLKKADYYFDRSRLFLTKEEAQAELDRRNTESEV